MCPGRRAGTDKTALLPGSSPARRRVSLTRNLGTGQRRRLGDEEIRARVKTLTNSLIESAVSVFSFAIMQPSDTRTTALSSNPRPSPSGTSSPRLSAMAALIFSSRWLQLPLYLGLIVAQGVYVLLFLKELWHLVSHAASFGEMEIMLIVLGLIDVVMISNLLVMVIVGGYETFVSRLRLEGHPDQPEWLSHVNASVLKVKLAMAIIGISSIHLLRTFIEAGGLGSSGVKFTESGVMWQTIIHCVFILSAIGIAYVDRLLVVPAGQTKSSAH